MNAANVEPPPWARQKWWALILLVFAVHIGFIFAFGNRKPVKPNPPAPSTSLQLASPNDELIALRDPTLFALPNRHSFSGAAWLNVPEFPFQPYRWFEPPKLLSLPVARLGATFMRLTQTNSVGEFAFENVPIPSPTFTTLPSVNALTATGSTFRLVGDIAKLRWLNLPELHAWPATDLLTNTVVQITVRNDGSVFSAKVLPPGSGSSKADDFAISVAESARFSAPRDVDDKLAIGAIVFEWATLPLPDTNAPNPNQ